MTAEQFFNEGDWWRRDGAFRLLHDINPLRLRVVESAAGGALGGKRLLDLGCGGGIFCEAAAHAGARTTGCDISSGAIGAAKSHAEQNGVRVDYHCGEPDMKDAGKYDVLTCFEMLEHAEDPAAVVADAAAMLKPGGVAVFSTINRTPEAWAKIIIGLEQVLKILPPGTHQYERFIPPRTLTGFCNDCGLSVRRIVGMDYSFFGRTYFLRENRMAVNYFLTAERRT